MTETEELISKFENNEVGFFSLTRNEIHLSTGHSGWHVLNETGRFWKKVCQDSKLATVQVVKVKLNQNTRILGILGRRISSIRFVPIILV